MQSVLTTCRSTPIKTIVHTNPTHIQRAAHRAVARDAWGSGSRDSNSRTTYMLAEIPIIHAYIVQVAQARTHTQTDCIHVHNPGVLRSGFRVDVHRLMRPSTSQAGLPAFCRALARGCRYCIAMKAPCVICREFPLIEKGTIAKR